MVIQARLQQIKPARRRASPRRKISLESSLQATGDPVTIHDFSSTGMLIETASKLPLLGGIEIDLPEAGNTRAVVVWNSGRYYGCEFKVSLPKAVVSAALLRSQPKPPEVSSQPRPIVAMRANVDETEALPAFEAVTTPDEEKAPLSVRLRVILGSSIILWALIIKAVWSVIRLVR